MPTEPTITLLSYHRRKRFFWTLVTVFLVTLPLMIFYTTGYRLSYVGDVAQIVPTGGLYVNTDSPDVELWVNEQPVQNARLFRSAYYIQNIAAGMHRVVASQPGFHTWVKQVPVDSYLVTETTAFNFPIIPQIRLITEFETATGSAVVSSDQARLLVGVSTTPQFFIRTRQATSTLVGNPEFVAVTSLFQIGSSSATSSSRTSILEAPSVPQGFRFATSGESEFASTTIDMSVSSGNMRLFIRDGEIYAKWVGALDRVPQYFCLTAGTASTTIKRYGQHVYDQLDALRASTTPFFAPNTTPLCRPEIKLDRKRQVVYGMDFVPGRTDLALLLLADGVYVSEIDDWSWQYTQRLYSSDQARMVIDNSRIYLYDQGLYFELLLTLITQRE